MAKLNGGPRCKDPSPRFLQSPCQRGTSGDAEVPVVPAALSRETLLGPTERPSLPRGEPPASAGFTPPFHFSQTEPRGGSRGATPVLFAEDGASVRRTGGNGGPGERDGERDGGKKRPGKTPLMISVALLTAFIEKREVLFPLFVRRLRRRREECGPLSGSRFQRKRRTVERIRGTAASFLQMACATSVYRSSLHSQMPGCQHNLHCA